MTVDREKVEVMTDKERIKKAVEIAEKYAFIDGAHHKNWVIDEMISALLTEEQRETHGWNDENWLEECIAP